MTHEQEVKEGNEGGRRCAGQRGIKGGKWDNCNSIINKIYFLEKKNFLGRRDMSRWPGPVSLLSRVPSGWTAGGTCGQGGTGRYTSCLCSQDGDFVLGRLDFPSRHSGGVAFDLWLSHGARLFVHSPCTPRMVRSQALALRLVAVCLVQQTQRLPSGSS